MRKLLYPCYKLSVPTTSILHIVAPLLFLWLLLRLTSSVLTRLAMDSISSSMERVRMDTTTNHASPIMLTHISVYDVTKFLDEVLKLPAERFVVLNHISCSIQEAMK